MRMMHAAVAEAALRKMMAAYSAEAPVREAPVSREYRSRGRRSQRKPQMITSDAAVAEQKKAEQLKLVSIPVVVEEVVPIHDVAKTDDDDEGAFSDAYLSGSSIDGDSVASAGVSSETELVRAQPAEPIQGNRSPGKSSKYSEEWEVGNFGVYFGNWGERASSAGKEVQQRRRAVHDRQIQKNPCAVVVMCEANPQCEELLKKAAVAGDPEGSSKLQRRPTATYMVVRGQEPKTSLLIAARTDNCEFLHQLGNYDVHKDHEHTEKGKTTNARTRMLFGKVGFKQNIGHLGKEIVVGAVHGHSKTMNYRWPTVLEEFWNRLAGYITSYGVQILTGDFNMSFTEVIPQLRSRGITIDCISWYPWMHETLRKDDQAT